MTKKVPRHIVRVSANRRKVPEEYEKHPGMVRGYVPARGRKKGR